MVYAFDANYSLAKRWRYVLMGAFKHGGGGVRLEPVFMPSHAFRHLMACVGAAAFVANCDAPVERQASPSAPSPQRVYSVGLDAQIAGEITQRSATLTEEAVRLILGKVPMRSASETGTPEVFTTACRSPCDADFEVRIRLSEGRAGGYTLEYEISDGRRVSSGRRARSAADVGATSRRAPYPPTAPDQLNARVAEDLTDVSVELCELMGADVCTVLPEFKREDEK